MPCFDLFLLKCSVPLFLTLFLLQLPVSPALTLGPHDNWVKRTKAMLTYFSRSNAGEVGLQRGFKREEDNDLNWRRK